MVIVDCDDQVYWCLVVGIGWIIGWFGGSLWIGCYFGQVQDYVYYVIQILLVMEGGFCVLVGSWEDWCLICGMVVMLDCCYWFDGCGVVIVMFFVELMFVCGVVLQWWFVGFDVVLLVDWEVYEVVQYLYVYYVEGVCDVLMVGFVQGVICCLVGNLVIVFSQDLCIIVVFVWMCFCFG